MKKSGLLLAAAAVAADAESEDGDDAADGERAEYILSVRKLCICGAGWFCFQCSGERIRGRYC